MAEMYGCMYRIKAENKQHFNDSLKIFRALMETAVRQTFLIKF